MINNLIRTDFYYPWHNYPIEDKWLKVFDEEAILFVISNTIKRYED